MFWQNRATHAVPSACSKYPPVGNGALRSKTPILSSPRNPPSKRFLPKRSLRSTHQPKLAVSLPNTRFRKSRSVLPRNTCSQIREFLLGIFIQVLHVRVGRRAVEVKIVF